MRSAKDFIEAFVDRVSPDGAIDDEWTAFVTERQATELAALIEEERLKPEPARAFVTHALRDGAVPRGGTALAEVLPAVSRFSAGGAHAELKQRVLARIEAFVARFAGLGADEQH